MAGDAYQARDVLYVSLIGAMILERVMSRSSIDIQYPVQQPGIAEIDFRRLRQPLLQIRFERLQSSDDKSAFEEIE